MALLVRALAALAILICFAPQALAKDAKVKQAEKISWKAVKSYKQGRYREAAELFLQAHDLSKHPAQLRNAAKAYERAGLFDEALAVWQRYRNDPRVNTEEQEEADASMASLRERQESARLAQAPPRTESDAAVEPGAPSNAPENLPSVQAEPPPPPPPAAAGGGVPSDPLSAQSSGDEDRGMGRAMPYALLGTGGALGVAGGVLWIVAANRLSHLDERIAMRSPSGLIVGISPEEVDAEVGGINQQRVVSGVLFGVGAAAITASVIWLLSDPEPSEGESGSNLGAR